MIKEGLREAYGNKVSELAGKDKRIVSLDADLGGSTMSKIIEKEHPENFFEMSIAEQNMASFAAGLSLTGRIPFINSFAMFDSCRCYEQIRQSIGTAHLNVKIVGSSAGLSDFGDGATHQCIEDIALMRVIPGMVVVEPVDANQTRAVVEAAVEHDGPMYIRINRNDLPVLTPADQKFEIGKIYEMRDGKDAVMYTGSVGVSIALEAAEILEKKGISLKVLNVSTLKPLENEYVASFAEGMKAVFTMEEHNIIGGLNSLVCQAIAGKFNGHVEGIAVPDRFGFSTRSYEELQKFFGFTAEDVAAKIEAALK